MTPDELAEQLRRAGYTVSLAMNVSTDGAAAVLHTSTRTLERWRRLGEGPPYIFVARRAWYPLAGLIAYDERHGPTLTATPFSAKEDHGNHDAQHSTRRH